MFDAFIEEDMLGKDLFCQEIASKLADDHQLRNQLIDQFESFSANQNVGGTTENQVRDILQRILFKLTDEGEKSK